jgi:hypothetical protein
VNGTVNENGSGNGEPSPAPGDLPPLGNPAYHGHAAARLRRSRRARRQRRLTVAVLGVGVFVSGTVAVWPVDPGPGSLQRERAPVEGIWLSPDEVVVLPMEGKAWRRVERMATEAWDEPNLADQKSNHDLQTLAGALYAVRTGDATMKERVERALASVPGTEDGGRSLALGRNIVGYVIAADLIGYRDPGFEGWLDAVRFELLDGRSLISTHEERPNNWGTHAGAARVVIDRFLEDDADLSRAAAVFKGFLGDRDSYAGFVYGDDLSWQADPAAPVGINPVGAQIQGHPVDGVIPDDARRVGPFTWPFPAGASGSNYEWESLQGIVVQAEVLHRAGFDAWAWEDRAVLRACLWLFDVAAFPAEGDDTWQTWLVNDAYGINLPTVLPARTGKNMGFTDWTHAPLQVPG